MEIAHTQTGILRLIGKLVLLGLFVILLAKAILVLLALAARGVVAYFCVRAIYIRRGYLKRTLLWTAVMLLRSVTAVFRAGISVLVAAVGGLLFCASWVLLTLIQFTWASARKTVRRFYTLLAGMVRAATVVGHLLSRAAKISCIRFWQSLRQSQEVLTSAFGVFFCCISKIAGILVRILVQGCVGLARIGGMGVVSVRRQSGLICGTFVEAASGAVVGAILFNLKSIEGFVVLPEVSNVFGARLCAAAIFGAFLGIAVGLSRARWAKEGETDPFPENQN